FRTRYSNVSKRTFSIFGRGRRALRLGLVLRSTLVSSVQTEDDPEAFCEDVRDTAPAGINKAAGIAMQHNRDRIRRTVSTSLFAIYWLRLRRISGSLSSFPAPAHQNPMFDLFFFAPTICALVSGGKCSR